MKGRLFAVLLVLLGGSSYGIVSTVVKFAYDQNFTPAEVTGAQFLCSVLLLVGMVVIRREKFNSISKKDYRILALLGVFSTGTSVFYYESLNYLEASLSIVLLFQFSWIIVIIDFIFKRQIPPKQKSIGIIAIFLGTLLAVDVFHANWQHISVIGIVFGLLSSITYASFLYGTSMLSSESGPFVRSTFINMVAMLIVFIMFPPQFLWNGAIVAGLWKWGLLIGILSQVIPLVLFNIGIPVIGGSTAGVLGSIELPVSVVMSYLILREAVGLLQWLGVLIILTGIVVSELKFARRSAAMS